MDQPLSNLTPEEQITLNTYDTLAEDWSNISHLEHFWEAEMIAFSSYLPKGSILEIGAGSGKDAKELIALGYEYTGTDISESFLTIARKENPSAPFLHQSVYDLSFPKNSFDGFWASAVLLHIPKARIDEALERILSSMKPGAIGFISLKQGDNDRVVKETRNNQLYERFFAFWQYDEFEEVLKKHRITVLEAGTRFSHPTTWLTYIVRCP